MNESTQRPNVPHVEPRKTRVSAVWIIPIVAALAGGGVMLRAYLEKGPIVTIRFSGGAGLEAGKTKIRFKSIDVGTVTDVTLADDLSSVVATAELDPGARPFLNDATVFWVVRPQIGASGISGLDTLLSGSYIGVIPARGGKPTRSFEAKDQHPLLASHPDALRVTLRAPALGSIRPGTQITYRNIQAGEVASYTLDADGRGVSIEALIDPTYAGRVGPRTTFWNASGIDVQMGAGGLKVHTESLAALLAGGIAFEPAPVKEEAVDDGHVFELHATSESATRARERYTGLEVLVESLDAGSLSVGAPVTYRQQRIGHVGEHALSVDATTVHTRLHIEPHYAPLIRQNSRFWNISGVKMHVGLDGLDVKAGSLASILEGGVAVATPDRPGAQAKSGALFALHANARPEWLRWSPAIHLGGPGAGPARHVIARPSATPPGLHLVLEASHAASMKQGDPITYRQVQVGEIEGHELAGDARSVKVHVRIDPRYAGLVRTNSRFWNASGIHAHLGLSGLQVDTDSLESILAGGVAFATPDEPGPAVEAGTLFPVHARPEESWARWSPAIQLPGADPGATVHHAIHVENREGFFGRHETVASEAVAADGTREPAAPPAVAADAEPGFFRRVFGQRN